MGTMIEIDGPGAQTINAYRAEPVGQLRGALIVIHEIWGLVPHITNLADRIAGEGYLVVAPDILSVVGTTPEVGAELHAAMGNPDEAVRLAIQPRLREAFSAHRSPEFAAGAVASLRSVADYLLAQPGIGGRLGVTGYCFGGTYSFALAAADPRVRAAVPWYGTAPTPEAMPGIACPVLAIYGSDDEPLMSALPSVISSMADAGVQFTAKVYDGAKHAFFNDTGANYDADAAAHAWPLALGFLDSHLPER